MYKVVQSNAANAGFGLTPERGSSRISPTLLLEKNSADRAGQLDWTASLDRVDPRVVEWLKKQSLDFDRYVYCMVVPLGADESWEQTTNGDAFKREMLAPENPEWGHKSFERHANAFRNHRNSNPELGFGDVPFTVFNPEMDRVEGVWRLDRDRAQKVGALDVVERIAKNGAAEISMGCRVPYDVCSYCGNRAKNVRQYCSHVRNPGFGAINAVGELMRVFNPWPKFFDLSDVRVPAAPEAHVLMLISPELAKQSHTKTSSGARFVVPSAVLGAERYGTSASGLLVPQHYKASSAAEHVKLSDIVKRAPVLEAQVIRPLQRAEGEITEEKIKSSGVEGLPLPSVLSTMASLGIVCSPEEICRVIEASTGERHKVPATLEIKQAWDSVTDSHPHLSSGFYSPVIADKLRGMVPDRSIFFPHLPERIASYDYGKVHDRIEMGAGSKATGQDFRISVEIESDGPMNHIARYIASYLKTLSVKLGRMLAEVSASYPSHQTHCLGAGLLTGPASNKNASPVGDHTAAVAFPSSYILSRAGKGDDGEEMQRSIDSLHFPGIEHLFGGLLAP